jgi:isoaspartyl peptidase/L-asparaginase-like protein (Ntn-hydrolase superfamily)
MEATPHVMLAGNNARRFALQEGFPSADLTTPESVERWRRWKLEQTAPDVAHFDDPAPRPRAWSEEGSLDQTSHDTVGVLALDRSGNLAAGCTTSGIAWKRPGRVGDSPLVGSGLYVDNEIGAAAATGNGDEMMKVCLSFRVVALMEEGRTPQEACEAAIRYLLRKRPHYQSRGAACIAVSRNGSIGAAATRAGFRAPDRLWQYAYSEGDSVRLVEGVYIE